MVVAGIAVLDAVAELLPVGRAAAGVGIYDHVAFGRHPQELVRERRAIRGVRAAVDLENRGVLFGRIEAGRLENPALNPRAVERTRPEHLGRGQVERRPQRVVRARDDLKPAGPIEAPGLQVGDSRGRRRQQRHLAVARCRESLHFVVAVRDRADRCADRIDAYQIRAALRGRHGDQRGAVSHPHRAGGAAASRRALVACERRPDVVVVALGQVGDTARGAIDDEEV